MKLRIIILSAFISATALSAQNEIQNQDPNIIQLALLLDVSGSMNGLINQAKSELWTIVNEVAKAQKFQTHSRLEIALYEYGRTNNPSNNGYIVKLLDYTSDLDTISKVLFSLNTYGGDEYCGWVIDNALKELQWRSNPSIYRVIFIAGNEPFNQGKIDYKKPCSDAKEKGIYINTIHCGDSMTGVRTFWKEGASIAEGEYFFINHNSRQYEMPTPYDSMIGVYNDSLNTTYWNFGISGASYKTNQMVQDKNAKGMSEAVKAKRAVSKTKQIYKNEKWDAVDASQMDSTWLNNTKDDDLPIQLKGKKMVEKKIALDSASKKRQYFSEQINKLNILRESYIKDHKPITAEKTLGTALIEAIHKQAMSKGFVFE